MDTLVAQLSPAHRLSREADGVNGDAAGWGSMGGFGNLARNGSVKGMSIPRVPDVSGTMVRFS